MNDQGSRQALARRLRGLREESWPGRKVNQDQLAKALSGDGRRSVSVPLISSWESRSDPKVPPANRVEDIATFFASPRSFDGHVGHLLSPDEMTVQERAEREKLLEELTRLRGAALDAAGMSQRRDTTPGVSQEINHPPNTGPYHFKPGDDITIVSAQLPPEMLEHMPYADPSNPDFIALYQYSELDALLELFGHLRAANPASRVEFRAAHELRPDDYTPNLVSLGGVDWNLATISILDRLQLPVTQVAHWREPGGAYFEVAETGGRKIAHRPVLEEANGRKVLREDVALFARAVSPFNRRRFVTICNGMYGRGTYGAVRALTDERFRDRNAEYLQETFGDSEAFCLLTRVTVEHGATLTPDWTLPDTVLFEWSR